jgi:16S rRNA (cytosine1402-N4)-methyltransferase
LPSAPFHTPVLPREVLSFLLTAPGGTYVDATLGGGGHALLVLQRLDLRGRLIGIDADHDALTFARDLLNEYGQQFIPVHDRFGNIKEVLAQLGISSVLGILFDLGVSSHQLDEPSKGFTFRANERLDMRMDRAQPRDAVLVLNTLDRDELERILREYGEERHARKIASRIVERRKKRKIEMSGELSGIVEEVVGKRFLTKSLARVFQAIRIEVNDELHQLEQALNDSLDLLSPTGRMVVISYHSLEDRIVKQFLKAASATSIPSATKLAPPLSVEPRLRILTRKVVEATAQEQAVNPRARSARLRAAEKI